MVNQIIGDMSPEEKKVMQKGLQNLYRFLEEIK